MFTGLVEGLGRVVSAHTSAAGILACFEARFALDDVGSGDSISVNGACLTVTRLQGNRFWADVSRETLDKTTLGEIKAGDPVNLERALRMGARLGGHLVTGHIDGIGALEGKRPIGNATWLRFGVAAPLMRYIVQKGSIAIDGVSLTVNSCMDESFDVCIIPHTAKETTLCFKEVGHRVNIETDIIGKYVESILGPHLSLASTEKKKTINLDFLEKNGFL